MSNQIVDTKSIKQLIARKKAFYAIMVVLVNIRITLQC